MFSFDTITRLIVGSAAAQRSEYKRLDRKYKDAEANLKLITTLTRGSSLPSSINSVNGSSASSGSFRARMTTLDEATTEEPVLKRTLSTPAVANLPMSEDQEELRRSYSDSHVKDTHVKIPVPPLPQMIGFGKYRRAVDASTSWQLNHLEQKLNHDGDIIAKFLGDEPPMGLDADVWHQYRTTRIRHLKDSPSTVSSIYRSPARSSSAPISDVASEYTDPTTGTKVVRGFTISKSITTSRTTSAASSVIKNWTPIKEHNRTRISPLSKVQRSSEIDLAASDASGCAVASDDEDGDWTDEE